MKTLIGVQTTIKDGIVTITGKIIDQQFLFPCQQVTIGHLNPANVRWPRHIQVSGEAVFVKAYGNGFAITNDDLVAIAAVVEPKTSFSPFYKSMPKPDTLSVELVSELNPDLQWQESADNKEWKNIEGATGSTLDRTKIAAGTWVRCVASSEAGATATPGVKI